MEEPTGFFDRPWVKVLTGLFLCIVFYVVLGFWIDTGQHPFAIVFDVFVAVVGGVVWMIFFSQFVLPVRTLKERWKVLNRLIQYLMQSHGAAIFIENGIIREREGESRRRGPGVLWLDSASAAILRTPVKFTRTIGPGIHFTTKKEYIAATVDLHTHSQSIGPAEHEDPFRVHKDHEEYEAIQNRRWETSALTRDGIEVVAFISVTFRIKATPGEGGTPFGYNAANVEKAIRESLIQGAKLDDPVWSPLPAKMVVDVWREYLRKFKLNQLFETPEGKKETAIQMIAGLLKKRLGQEKVEALDDFGNPIPDDLVDSEEYATLQNMGLEVTGINIRRLFFKPEIEERLVSQWTTTWLKNAKKESEQVERDRKLSETRGQEDALKEFAVNASQEIAQVRPDDLTHALEMLVHSTFLGVRRNTLLLRRTSTEQRDLADIARWLHDQRGDHHDGG